MHCVHSKWLKVSLNGSYKTLKSALQKVVRIELQCFSTRRKTCLFVSFIFLVVCLSTTPFRTWTTVISPQGENSPHMRNAVLRQQQYMDSEYLTTPFQSC